MDTFLNPNEIDCRKLTVLAFLSDEFKGGKFYIQDRDEIIMPTILKTKNSVTTTVVPTTLQQGELAVNITDKKLWVGNAATTPVQLLGAGVTGDVVGPASATDNAISRFDGTTGKLIQNSLVTVSDTGAISAPVDASISGLTVGKGGGAVVGNSAIGFGALANNTGSQNTAVGYNAMTTNTSGVQNAAVGQGALNNNTTGGQNAALGYVALFSNTSGSQNTAFGSQALTSNTTGAGNSSFGYQSLITNTTAGDVTAIGYQTGYSNTTGTFNTFVGSRGAGFSNTTASQNTFIGDFAGRLTTTGGLNTFLGQGAGRNNVTGIENIAIGIDTLNGASGSGGYNVAVGNNALNARTTGANNVAIGWQSLFLNTTASNNTAVGYQAAYTNTTGTITAFGALAGYANTTGVENTAIGNTSLRYNTTGNANSAFGLFALFANTTGANNTAVGRSALESNTTASDNTALGYQAAYSNTTGAGITAIGKGAAFAVTGNYNTIMGWRTGEAITSGTDNTFVGALAGALSTGSQNTFIGGPISGVSNGTGAAMTTGSKNCIIGRYNGNQGGLDIRTQNNYIVLSDGDANIRQYTNPNGFTKISNGGGGGVLSPTGLFHEIVSTDGNGPTLIAVSTSTSMLDKCLQIDAQRNTSNGTFQAIGYYNRGANAWRMYVQDSGNLQNTNNSYGAISDIKLKENIADASPKLEDLCKVKVRTYNFKSDQTHKQIGVVAQELEEVFPGLVEQFNDKDGDGNDLGTTTKAVKYSVFVPMLIKAIQELKAEVDSLKQQINGV
jgi:hypothetical protein